MAISKIVTNSVDSGVTLTSPVMNTITSAASTALTLQSAGTTAVTIDTSQNVGIATSSPRVRLDVRSDAVIAAPTPLATAVASGVLAIGDTVGSVVGLQLNGSSYDTYIQSRNMGAASTPYNLLLQPLGGNLLVGTTTTYGKTTSASAAASYVYASVSIGNQADHMVFKNDATTTGSITRVGATNVAYNTSSDYRLKYNISPMTGALDKVAKLKPCTYTWRLDDSDGEGFIAHELAEVCPHAVSGKKDAVDENGDIKAQGIDTSFLVSILTAAIQEQQALITQLQADVAELKVIK